MKLRSEHKERVFIIEEDFPEVGAYLYVYEGGQCTKDYLQDSVEVCKELGLEDYGVPLSQWETVEEE